MNEWLDVALERSVVFRSLKYAAVVGSLLIVINHGDAILAATVSRERLVKMVLTMLVPYVVSTLSSVGAIRDTRR